ncbi:MAG: glycosyltransferase family 2 protein [Butyrivibrio sp.]|nr:glycosyltransferase family 2 protein [Butyrivibrio sp.]
MDDKLISVIVPVYNVANYIRECLDSILAQTYSSFELLLVDDGSTDGSGSICDEYKERNDRIKVFHKENGGLSSARNKGLDEARGEYICFIDSDDTIRADYLDKLYSAITTNGSDMAFCDIDAAKLTKEPLKDKLSANLSKDTAKYWLYDDRTREYVLMVVAWNKIYAKKLFDNIRYSIGKLHEDEFVIGALLNECDSVSFVPEKLYFYRENESGITSNANKMNVKHLDGVDALSERAQQALGDGESSFAAVTVKNALYKCARFYKEAVELTSKEMKRASMKKYKDVYWHYRKILSKKQQIKYMVFMICPALFIKVFNP